MVDQVRAEYRLLIIVNLISVSSYDCTLNFQGTIRTWEVGEFRRRRRLCHEFPPKAVSVSSPAQIFVNPLAFLGQALPEMVFS